MTTITERRCEQRCGAPATVYGGGRKAGDWAGWYCEPCITKLGFQIWDRVTPSEQPETDEQYDGKNA